MYHDEFALTEYDDSALCLHVPVDPELASQHAVTQHM